MGREKQKTGGREFGNSKEKINSAIVKHFDTNKCNKNKKCNNLNKIPKNFTEFPLKNYFLNKFSV
jgi:hypothetical protein